MPEAMVVWVVPLPSLIEEMPVSSAPEMVTEDWANAAEAASVASASN
jgi:hypothetical protein